MEQNPKYRDMLHHLSYGIIDTQSHQESNI